MRNITNVLVHFHNKKLVGPLLCRYLLFYPSHRVK